MSIPGCTIQLGPPTDIEVVESLPRALEALRRRRLVPSVYPAWAGYLHNWLLGRAVSQAFELVTGVAASPHRILDAGIRGVVKCVATVVQQWSCRRNDRRSS